MEISLPQYAAPLFQPFRNKVLLGGRGSAKSFSIAKALIIITASQKKKVLCGREFQNSINDSVHSLLRSQIEEMKLSHLFSIKQNSIESTCGSEFLFKGVRHNVNSIKSIPDIDILWLEEADTISQTSWDILIPTIRKDGSEIWCSYNPNKEDDPTHKKFVNTKNPPANSYIVKVSYKNNPWFPEVLRKEMEYQYKVDPDLAMHIWEGECRTHSDAQIFKDKWEFRHFEVQDHWDGPYFGADWGFSTDPSILTRSYIDHNERILYVRNGSYGYGVELDDLPEFFSSVPMSRERLIRADNSRPETISYISRKGFNIEAARKWPGSVQDGITWLRSFQKIIIHTDCPNVRDEFKNYSYKVDRLTGDVTTDIIDLHNHGIDGLRYALEPLISAGNLGILDVL